jgi:hypothetical protein
MALPHPPQKFSSGSMGAPHYGRWRRAVSRNSYRICALRDYRCHISIAHLPPVSDLWSARGAGHYFLQVAWALACDVLNLNSISSIPISAGSTGSNPLESESEASFCGCCFLGLASIVLRTQAKAFATPEPRPAGFRLCVQLIEKRPGIFQIGGVEPFGEPVVDFGKHRAGFVAAALAVEQPREADRGAQLEGFRPHALS